MDERTLIKLRSGALYGKTVYNVYAGKDIFVPESYTDPCKHCIHFNDETFTCDKIHHCDCDCPDCSTESYVDPEDFYADDADEIDDDEFFDNITKVYDNPWNDLKLDELLGK